VQATRFVLDYEVIRLGDGAVVAGGCTSMVAFDYAKRRPIRLPDAFHSALRALTRA
jgi:acyl-CoA thioesterase FadM